MGASLLGWFSFFSGSLALGTLLGKRTHRLFLSTWLSPGAPRALAEASEGGVSSLRGRPIPQIKRMEPLIGQAGPWP